jgi:hypothetical protein
VNWLGAALQYAAGFGAVAAAGWMAFFGESRVVVMTPAAWVLFACLELCAVLANL